MRIIYYFATALLHYLLRPYLHLRILKKKESPIRFREKLGITNTQRPGGYLMWFHCASIGELKSIFPIIDHYVKKNRILLTTSTLSSSEIFYKKYSNNKNIIHQFAPIDSPQIVKRFFLKWKPNIIFFTDSELWPNQIFYAKNKLHIEDAKHMVKIGDSCIDIEEGKNAGCLLNIGITTGAQTEIQLMEAKPDYIVHSLTEMLEILEKYFLKKSNMFALAFLIFLPNFIDDSYKYYINNIQFKLERWLSGLKRTLGKCVYC